MAHADTALLLFLAAAAVAAVRGTPLPHACGKTRHGSITGSAVKDASSGLWRFVNGVEPGAAAYGGYVDSSLTDSNFGKLRIVTSADASDEDQMAAAGFLEGWLTAGRINDHYHNVHHYFTHQLNASLERPMQWVSQQDAWLHKQVAAVAAGGDPYWRSVGLLLLQLEGLWLGYSAAMDAAGATGSVSRLDRSSITFLNANGELYDVLDMLDEQAAQARLDAMGPQELLAHVALQGKCSALIKVTADLSDILFGHSTWDSYTAMTRIYKHFTLNLNTVAGIAARSLSFSSYPGELFSDDDFYISSAGLVVLETTNHIYDFSILRDLSPATVPSWLRVRTANLLASNGSAWVDIFRRYNSGTYNNQYMVADLKRFEPRRQLREGLLWVVEQLPGMVEAADVTDVLARGHWPSYNVAYFPSIYEAAGYPRMVALPTTHGPQYDQPARWLMYQVSPRASIFRRDQGGLSSLDDMKRLMRYNGYPSDTLSDGHPYASVCARGDLAPHGVTPGAVPKGCYDTKVTSYKLAMVMESEVVGGPTTSGGALPPFEWDKRWKNFEHRGMPDRFDFSFERQSASDLPLPGLDCQSQQPSSITAV